MRDINIGIEGVSLKVDSESFWVASEVPLQVVSSSVVGATSKRPATSSACECRLIPSNETTPFADLGPSSGTEPGPWGSTTRLWA